ncbi:MULTISPECIES: DUF5690 family protein [Sphingobacterium]|uniref:DUF5690 family protein n=1 Tax=Sphingobacterium TaxID=28453 RepID=UPI0010F1730F|nr:MULTISPECIES: DUF5690 family protein [Sphingobacterium]MCW2261007.1 hypothetical protein [Sphingobacterium kitahiroshimense]TCR08357.1 hypothetical protein EDF67_107146 [Sphingobacterium sp. JUb78]
MELTQRFKQRISQLDERSVAMILALTAFLCYTCMYSFRKSFTAASYDDASVWGINYKVCLVITQMVGYMFSKFYGIKFIAESKQKNRGRYLIILICISWLSLLAFAWCPRPWNIIFLLLNGFPLGMVWGLVFSYLEGRRYTEIMGAVMAVSLIFASGLIKTVGRWLMATFPIDEYWMPFCTGFLFLLPFIGCVWLLEHAPGPTEQDKALRTERVAMDSTSRKEFFKMFKPGILLTVVIYTMLTIIRDVRDNFEIEIWEMLHVKGNGIFAKVDGIIALIVLVLVALLIVVKDNLKAFKLIHMLIIVGFLIAGGSTYLFSHQLIDGLSWMLLVGLGLYLAYIPYNAIFFERMIATYKMKSNIGFVMYLADSIGYLGSFIVLLNKELLPNSVTWGSYFIQLVFFASIIGGGLSLLSLYYFARKKEAMDKQEQEAEKLWCVNSSDVQIS